MQGIVNHVRMDEGVIKELRSKGMINQDNRVQTSFIAQIGIMDRWPYVLSAIFFPDGSVAEIEGTNEDLADLRGKSLMIGMPCYGGVSYLQASRSLQTLQMACNFLGIRFHSEQFGNESLITRGRNNITCKFLFDMPDKNWDYLMFIDADIGFTPAMVLRQMMCGHPVCGAIYPKKGPNVEQLMDAIEYEHTQLVNQGKTQKEAWEIAKKNVDFAKEITDYNMNFYFHRRNDESLSLEYDMRGYVRVRHIANGFLLTHRKVFLDLIERKMVEPYFNQKREKEPGERTYYDFFRVCPDPFNNKDDPKKRIYLSEDWFFCDLVIEAGYAPMADMFSNLTHTGTFTFGPGSLIEHVERTYFGYKRGADRSDFASNFSVPMFRRIIEHNLRPDPCFSDVRGIRARMRSPLLKRLTGGQKPEPAR
jgi:hypothetical protein